nr:hypothetical protein [uncultured Mediterranean phage uvMED]
MWQTLISPIANIAGGYLKNKAEQGKAKHEAKMKVIQNDGDWESKAVDATQNSWRDEFWTIVLSIPIFMIGYSIVVGDPNIVVRVEDGFNALSQLPEWYQYLLYIAISSSFGIKGVSKLAGLRK